MKLWKKIFLILLAIVFLAQIPFVFNRYKIGRLAETINYLQSRRVNLSYPGFIEYKGIIHAHTFLGGHSTGNFEEIIAGANSNNLDFVVVTEHFSDFYDSSALTLNGFYGKTLFVGGNEFNTVSGDRFLLIPGSADAPKFARQETDSFLDKIHLEEKIAFVTYPEKLNSQTADFDGIEVFSLHTNAKKMNPVMFFFDAIWSYKKYPELITAKYFARPEANLQKYDEIAAYKNLTLFAGSDAHSNLGFHLLGDDSGGKILNLKFDRYETIFRLVRTRVLLEKDKPLTKENLLDALKKGHSFIGFDVLGDPAGFSFTAENESAENKIMGDNIGLSGGVRLRANAPLAGRFIIFRNGEKIIESDETNSIFFEVKDAGAYRVEVYLDALGAPFDKMPWIISNPIYVR